MIVGCNMVFTGTIAKILGLTVADPMIWVWSALGAILSISVIDGWFPKKFPRGDEDDKGGDDGV